MTYTGVMAAHFDPDGFEPSPAVRPEVAANARRPPGISAIGYIGWLVISAEPAWRFIKGDIPISRQSLIGIAALILFPVLFALANPANTASKTLQRLGCRMVQPLVALLACWGLGEPMLAALIVISAGQLAGVFGLPTTFLVLLPADLLLFIFFRGRLDSLDLIVATAGNVIIQSFTALMVASTRRAQQARDEAMRINAELVATRRLLLEGARDEERLRISRELHDLVGHKLTALKLQLRLRARQTSTSKATDGSAANRDIDDACVKLADELLRDVRGVVSTLRASDGIDLHQALAALVPAVPYPHIELDLAADAAVPGLQQAHALLRCAQEGITNALRHSGCTRLLVRLTKDRQGVYLTIEDDGQARSAPNFGNGLNGLRERVVALGGSLDALPSREHGLKLVAFMPDAASAGPER